MKIAASIFSWLGGATTTIIAFVIVGTGVYVPPNFTAKIAIWVALVILAIFRLIILIWRQTSTSFGEKVKCGIFTLLFVSVIGGILTLCIPEDQLC